MAKFIFQAGVFFKRPLYPANTSTVVTVYDAETGSIAPIWNDRAGADPRANPGAIWQEGHIKLYLNPGRYNIVASNGSDSKTWNDVIIMDPDAGGGGGGGASRFTDLDDAPSSYTGQAGKAVRVNSGATGLEFYTSPDAGVVVNVTSSGGHVTFDAAQGKLFTLGLSENVTWMQIVNALPGDTIGIRITQDSPPRTVQLPANWFFTESSPITDVPTGAGHDAFLVLTTFDGGLEWYATMDKFQ